MGRVNQLALLRGQRHAKVRAAVGKGLNRIATAQQQEFEYRLGVCVGERRRHIHHARLPIHQVGKSSQYRARSWRVGELVPMLWF